MTAVSTYNPTGDPYLNGILYGKKWAVNSLTFSFPTDPAFYGASYAGGEQNNNFEAFTTVQQASVRAVLQNYAAVANLAFTEVTETATQHGELRYAESDAPRTASAYYPSTSAAGGDAWFNNSGNKYDNPVKGNYAYLTLLHETGHALGLKHSQDVKGSFAAMPADRDSLEYTVMSYRSYIGGPTTGYTLGASSYPQTLMMQDIAALQTLYGAKWSTNGGDTVYKWDALNGQMSLNGVGQGAPAGNKIFMTIWDGGGHDTYDFSNYTTNLVVSLAPGGWTTTSTTQLASLGSGRYAAGNIANALLYQGNLASLIENAKGGSGSDSITGNVADNRLTGNRGNDTLDGGAGIDTAVYSGLQANYTLAQNADGSWTIADRRSGAPDGTDLLRNMELLQFADGLRSISATTPPANTAPAITTAAPSATLTGWADAPVAANDGYAVGKNGKLTIAKGAGVLANDSDPDGNALSATLVTKPLHGALSFNADGSFSYTPEQHWRGTDSFSYRDSDGSMTSNVAIVTIGVGRGVGIGSGLDSLDGDLMPLPVQDQDWHRLVDLNYLMQSGFNLG